MDEVILNQLINQALTDSTAMIGDNNLAAICGIPAGDVMASVRRLAEKGLIEITGPGRYIIKCVKIDGKELIV